MPRGFTEEEKKTISAGLIRAGRVAFGRYGIKKTNVEDLAREAGISKGAFYHFFSSKEDLYFAIMRDYETGQHEMMKSLLEEECDDERERFKRIIKDIMAQLDSDPFLRSLMEKRDLAYLMRKFTPDQLEKAMEADLDLSGHLIELWSRRGKLKVDDPRVVTGVFRSLFFLYFHKEDVGEDVFPQVVDLMLDGALKKILRR